MKLIKAAIKNFRLLHDVDITFDEDTTSVVGKNNSGKTSLSLIFNMFLDEKNTICEGFYAAGECACVSVHGANRLGTNSLLDIIIFGRRGGKAIAKFLDGKEFPDLPDDTAAYTNGMLDRIKSASKSEKMVDVRTEMQDVMMDTCSVFREEGPMLEGLEKIKELKERYKNVGLEDTGAQFNMDLFEVIELGALLVSAETTLRTSIDRKESRGAHYREDYPKRDDEEWLKHSFIFDRKGEEPEIRYKPVVIKQFEPKERVY